MKFALDSINYLLIIPVALFFLIAAIICGIKGARRGPIRAVVSVALTLASAYAAILAARYVSGPLLKLANKLAGGGVLDIPGLSEEAQRTLDAVLRAGLSGILFGLFFAIIAILVKCLVSAIINGAQKKSKTDEEIKAARKAKSAAFKWSGALISILLDAVLITGFVFLPVYGTVARLAKSLQAVADTEIAEEKFAGQEKLVEGLTFVADNPVLSVTRTKPVTHVYSQIFSYSDELDAVSLESLWEAAQGILENIDAFLNSDGQDMAVNRVMGSCVQKAMGDNPSLRTLVLSIVSEKLAGGEEENPYAAAIAEICAAFDQDVAPEDKEAELDSLTLLSGVVRRIIAMKASEEDSPAPIETSSEVVSSSDDDNMYELICLAGDLTEALARHPNIGPKKAMSILKTLSATMGEETAAMFSDEVLLVLSVELSRVIDRPVGEGKFGEILKTAYLALNALSGLTTQTEQNSLVDLLLADKEVLQSVLGLMDADIFSGLGMLKSANKTAAIGTAMINAIIDTPLTEAEAPKEAESIVILMNVIMDQGLTSNTHSKFVLSDPQSFLNAIVNSKIVPQTVRNLVEENVSLSSLGTPVAKAFQTALNAVMKTFYAANKNPEILEKLNLMADFLGMNHLS